ncbi:MAG: hypothetical protein RL385_2597 [Pseudomonadota bacterium]|jgi:RND family efflux transporter MFP subunit
MSDRLILTLATVPMVSGVLLLGILQRGEARQEPALAAQVAHAAVRDAVPEGAKEWLGVVVAGQAAELASEFGGRVTQVFVQSGMRVKAGQLLLQVDRDDAAAAVGVAGAEVAQKESDVVRAEARLEAARQRLARLTEGGAWLSAQELDGARAEVRVADAELRSARSLVSMGRARLVQQRVRDKKHTIVAPFDGTVVSIDVDAGDTVPGGRVLARVISEDRRIKFALPREELDAANLSEVLVARPGMDTVLHAQVSAVRPEVDAAAHLVFATASLPDNPITDSWLPGTDVRVFRARTQDTIKPEK